MIGRLHGQIVDIQQQNITVDVQGVGYLVAVPHSVLELHHLDQTVTLYIQTVVREDAITLYGFLSVDDRRLFEQLVSVTGVGPKLALAILSTYYADQVQTAISTGQISAFTAVPGIGKKNAERIILELKNKVAVGQLTPNLNPQGGSNQLDQALAGLGYAAAEIAKVSQQIDSQQPVEDQIKKALRLLAQTS